MTKNFSQILVKSWKYMWLSDTACLDKSVIMHVMPDSGTGHANLTTWLHHACHGPVSFAWSVFPKFGLKLVKVNSQISNPSFSLLVESKWTTYMTCSMDISSVHVSHLFEGYQGYIANWSCWGNRSLRHLAYVHELGIPTLNASGLEKFRVHLEL